MQRNCPRITPACAGKRFLLRLSGCLLQDHPRMCGEKERDPDICINCPGSPPHVRGKVSGFCTILRPLGITPACAGKSCQTNYWLHSCRDHPRMCGEKWLARFSPFATMGSPPRMRGKETMENTQAKRTGITPAYAGKSVVDCSHLFIIWDHPRVCGEKHCPHGINMIRGGSPPRMRGKVQMESKRRYRDRITPAYAGKSCAIWI